MLCESCCSLCLEEETSGMEVRVLAQTQRWDGRMLHAVSYLVCVLYIDLGPTSHCHYYIGTQVTR
jgi:hypothetical protein